MKILSIVGARPQFIKSYPISRAIESYKGEIKEILLHTGQHYDFNLSKIFFNQLCLKEPDYNLGVGSNKHGKQTGEMIEGIEKIITKETPDLALIYGDTNSTLAGSIAAAKCQIPVGHIEAGLRSFNLKMPEEVNRVLADRISSYLFCPTINAVNILKREGFEKFNYSNSKFNKPKIILSGDVMYDAFLLCKDIMIPSEMVDMLVRENQPFYLCTIHRAENTDSKIRLNNILEALDEISKNVTVLFPVHPRTKNKILEYGIKIKNIILIEPVGYFDMLYLLDKCKAVFTDSGGLQKESYFSKKLCITLREETEWIELVDISANFLVGANKERIIKAEAEILSKKIIKNQELYGNGKSSETILKVIYEDFF